MKRIRLLIAFSLIVCFLLAVSACDSLPTLSSPDDLEIDDATLTLSWDEVKNARMYTISVTAEGSGEIKEYISSRSSYPLSQLDVGNYSIKVKANGKDGQNEDSDWSDPVPFTREREPGMVFTLINNGTEYEVSDKGTATGDIVIPTTYRNKPVTSIGNKAFFNKSDVTGITLSENIRSIGDFAFTNCSYLTSINLPSSLTSIGESAFASCRLLAGELVIPDGVSAIPKNAFAYCAKLTGVTFGSKVDSIGINAFTDCKSLTSITIPDSVTALGEYAFASCESVTELNIGNGLENIGDYAFSDLPCLESVVIPDVVTRIGKAAFYSCVALSDVTLGSGVEIVDIDAFWETALWNNSPTNEIYAGGWLIGFKDPTMMSVTFKENTVGIANCAFYGNQTITQLTLPDSVRIIGEGAFALTMLNSVVIGSGVEVVGAQAFAACQNLTNVILGSYDFTSGKLRSSNLKVIDSYAFRECASLRSIEIPESVTMIGTYAFRNSGIYNIATGGVVYAGNWLVDYTETLKGEVIVRDDTVGIANYAFYKCDTITSATLPSTVKIVGRAAFYDCGALVSVSLPETLRVIEDYTFYRCEMLKLFNLPPMLKSIGRSAFYKCGSIYIDGDVDTDADTLVIPSSVEFIGDYAFFGCGQEIPANQEMGTESVTHGIDVIIIGDGVKSIGNKAFYGFASLKRLVLGNGVESIGEKAFYKCTNLEDVTFGSALKTIGERAFYKCSALKSVILPDGVVDVGAYAFYKCESIISLRLGRSVTSIGDYAFYGCKEIKELYLPTSLTSIGKQAFRNCKALTSVILADNIDKIDAHAFYGCSLMTIYSELDGPKDGWNDYWNSSYRPVVWGCALSEEKDFVVSVEKREKSVTNRNPANTLCAPTRLGYSFIGWNTNASAPSAQFTAEELTDVTNGVLLYAIWEADTPAE